jgi:hypothetical protein
MWALNGENIVEYSLPEGECTSGILIYKEQTAKDLRPHSI